MNLPRHFLTHLFDLSVKVRLDFLDDEERIEELADDAISFVCELCSEVLHYGCLLVEKQLLLRTGLIDKSAYLSLYLSLALSLVLYFVERVLNLSNKFVVFAFYTCLLRLHEFFLLIV